MLLRHMVGLMAIHIELVLIFLLPNMFVENFLVFFDQVVSLCLLVLVNELVRVMTCTEK